MISYGTPFDSIFVDLETRLGCVVAPEDQPSQRDRVIFARSGAPEDGPAPYRVPGERTTGRTAHPYQATCYGATELEATDRRAALVAAIDELLGPPQGDFAQETLQPEAQAPVARGYAVKAGKLAGGVVGGDGTAAGYAVDVAITLYTRVRSQVRPLATVERVLVTIPEPQP